MANDHGVRSSQFLILIVFLICRTDDNIIALIRQSMVITNHNVRLVLVDAVTGDAVVGADDVVALAVFQGVVRAIYVVVLGRSVCCIGGILTGNGVTDTDDLGHVGAGNLVAAAHDHDLWSCVKFSYKSK